MFAEGMLVATKEADMGRRSTGEDLRTTAPGNRDAWIQRLAFKSSSVASAQSCASVQSAGSDCQREAGSNKRFLIQPTGAETQAMCIRDTCSKQSLQVVLRLVGLIVILAVAPSQSLVIPSV
jgi:hypothetical protein